MFFSLSSLFGGEAFDQCRGIPSRRGRDSDPFKVSQGVRGTP